MASFHMQQGSLRGQIKVKKTSVKAQKSQASPLRYS
jgi:hypothetical protein